MASLDPENLFPHVGTSISGNHTDLFALFALLVFIRNTSNLSKVDRQYGIRWLLYGIDYIAREFGWFLGGLWTQFGSENVFYSISIHMSGKFA